MILPLFKERDCDIWLLFDSCQAMPNAFNTTGRGVVAALAATGFEPGEFGVAPDVGSHSFTHTLVQVLGQRSVPSRADEGPRPFTDVSLHSQMLTELSKWPVYLQRDRDGSYRRSKHGHHVVEPCRRRTPIYQFLSRNKAPKPIYICPIPDNDAILPSHGQPQLDSETGDCSSPHVLISVRLGTDHLCDADIQTVVHCLHSIPGGDGLNAPMVTIEAIYPSLSTLLILRMPLALWDLLPKDESMSLIGYVTGANYAHSFRDLATTAMGSMPETESTKTEDCQISKSDYLGLEVVLSQQEISCSSARIVASQENVCQPSLCPFDLATFYDIAHAKNDRMQEWEDCLKSLAFPEMDGRLRSIDPPLSGTCTWLFDHPEYKQWASNDSSRLLWIRGRSGTGKSVLMKHMVDSLLESHIDEPNTCVIYFFFNSQGTELQRTPLGLFRSLLHQLSSRASNTRSDLTSTFAQRSRIIGKAGEKWHWSLEELQGFFKSTLSEVVKQRNVWLLIDALDECDVEGVEEVASYFRFLRPGFPSNGVHICISSRPHTIADAIGDYRITVEYENGQDILTYLHGRLSTLDKQRSAEVTNFIARRASGTFLWARLTLDRILPLSQEEAFGTELSSVPRSLPALYQYLIQKKIDDKAVALKLMQWITFSTRPLSLDEVRWIMVLDKVYHTRQFSQESQGAQGLTSNNEAVKEQICRLSGGLCVALKAEEDVSSTGAEAVPRKQVVTFIHQSVKEFFIHEGLELLGGGPSSRAAKEAHHSLFKACICYLEMDKTAQSANLDGGESLSRFTLLHYAVVSWIPHMEHSGQTIYLSDIRGYFNQSRGFEQVWVHFYNLIERSSSGCSLQDTYKTDALTRYQLIWPLRVLRELAGQDSVFIDAKDDDGLTPLSWATVNGYTNVIRLLLNAEADIGVKDNLSRMPLTCI